MKFEQTHRPRTSALSILALGLTLLLLPSSQAQTDQEFLGQFAQLSVLYAIGEYDQFGACTFNHLGG